VSDGRDRARSADVAGSKIDQDQDRQGSDGDQARGDDQANAAPDPRARRRRLPCLAGRAHRLPRMVSVIAPRDRTVLIDALDETDPRMVRSLLSAGWRRTVAALLATRSTCRVTHWASSSPWSAIRCRW